MNAPTSDTQTQHPINYIVLNHFQNTWVKEQWIVTMQIREEETINCICRICFRSSLNFRRVKHVFNMFCRSSRRYTRFIWYVNTKHSMTMATAVLIKCIYMTKKLLIRKWCATWSLVVAVDLKWTHFYFCFYSNQITSDIIVTNI